MHSLHTWDKPSVLICFCSCRSDRSNNPKIRIGNIIRFLTVTVWRNACRGFYERHKFLFTLLLAMKIDLQCGHISHEEFMKFIKVWVESMNEKSFNVCLFIWSWVIVYWILWYYSFTELRSISHLKTLSKEYFYSSSSVVVRVEPPWTWRQCSPSRSVGCWTSRGWTWLSSASCSSSTPFLSRSLRMKRTGDYGLRRTSQKK